MKLFTQIKNFTDKELIEQVVNKLLYDPNILRYRYELLDELLVRFRAYSKTIDGSRSPEEMEWAE